MLDMVVDPEKSTTPIVDMKENAKRIKLEGDDARGRLDLCLSHHLPELSRSRIQTLIKSGSITVNGRQVRAHMMVTEGMEVDISIPPPAPADVAAENIPLDILYEDADLLVVNKPAGLVVHPAAGHASGTLVNALLNHCDDISGVGSEKRPGIVHRLDKNTSGVLVTVKTQRAFTELAEQFKSGQVRKEYLAIVRGIPNPAADTIQTLIGRSRHDRKKMSARPITAEGQTLPGRRGKSDRIAITHYERIQTYEDCSLMRIRIETGRTHQIRVHMAHIGHPVLGDNQYGRKRVSDNRSSHNKSKISKDTGIHTKEKITAERQMLHAEILAFKHPRDGKKVKFKAPLPEDMKGLIQLLRDLSVIRDSSI